jgi:hypothetical protein
MHTLRGGDFSIIKEEEPSEISQPIKLNKIEEAIQDIKDKPTKTIDDKIKKSKIRKKEIPEEEAVFYFNESKSAIDYDFSYLGNLKKPNIETYAGAMALPDSNDILAEAETEITHDILRQIITVQKMDLLLGTKTGFVDMETKERFDVLKRMSFYEAMIRVNYDLHS